MCTKCSSLTNLPLNAHSYRLQHAEELIIAESIGLVIVDSVASLARKEFDGRASVRDRSEMLAQHAALLKYLAESFDLPVWCAHVSVAAGGKWAEMQGIVLRLRCCISENLVIDGRLLRACAHATLHLSSQVIVTNHITTRFDRNNDGTWRDRPYALSAG